MSKTDLKLDPRVLRTRQLLRSALISLIPEKGFSAITVQDITDRATLNRATFYLHYRDKVDLLEDVFEELMADAVPLPPEGDISETQIGHETIAFVLDHLADHANFFRVMLGEENVPEFTSRIREYVQLIGLRWITALKPLEDKILVPPELAIHFLGSAYLGVIGWWLQNDMPYSSDYMATQLMRLTVLGLNRSLGLEIPLEYQHL